MNERVEVDVQYNLWKSNGKYNMQVLFGDYGSDCGGGEVSLRFSFIVFVFYIVFAEKIFCYVGCVGVTFCASWFYGGFIF